jgi:hypothetical protein
VFSSERAADRKSAFETERAHKKGPSRVRERACVRGTQKVPLGIVRGRQKRDTRGQALFKPKAFRLFDRKHHLLAQLLFGPVRREVEPVEARVAPWEQSRVVQLLDAELCECRCGSGSGGGVSE